MVTAPKPIRVQIPANKGLGYYGRKVGATLFGGEQPEETLTVEFPAGTSEKEMKKAIDDYYRSQAPKSPTYTAMRNLPLADEVSTLGRLPVALAQGQPANLQTVGNIYEQAREERRALSEQDPLSAFLGQATGGFAIGSRLATSAPGVFGSRQVAEGATALTKLGNYAANVARTGANVAASTGLEILAREKKPEEAILGAGVGAVLGPVAKLTLDAGGRAIGAAAKSSETKGFQSIADRVSEATGISARDMAGAMRDVSQRLKQGLGRPPTMSEILGAMGQQGEEVGTRLGAVFETRPAARTELRGRLQAESAGRVAEAPGMVYGEAPPIPPARRLTGQDMIDVFEQEAANERTRLGLDFAADIGREALPPSLEAMPRSPAQFEALRNAQADAAFTALRNTPVKLPAKDIVRLFGNRTAQDIVAPDPNFGADSAQNKARAFLRRAFEAAENGELRRGFQIPFDVIDAVRKAMPKELADEIIKAVDAKLPEGMKGAYKKAVNAYRDRSQMAETFERGRRAGTGAATIPLGDLPTMQPGEQLGVEAGMRVGMAAGAQGNQARIANNIVSNPDLLQRVVGKQTADTLTAIANRFTQNMARVEALVEQGVNYGKALKRVMSGDQQVRNLVEQLARDPRYAQMARYIMQGDLANAMRDVPRLRQFGQMLEAEPNVQANIESLLGRETAERVGTLARTAAGAERVSEAMIPNLRVREISPTETGDIYQGLRAMGEGRDITVQAARRLVMNLTNLGISDDTARSIIETLTTPGGAQKVIDFMLRQGLNPSQIRNVLSNAIAGRGAAAAADELVEEPPPNPTNAPRGGDTNARTIGQEIQSDPLSATGFTNAMAEPPDLETRIREGITEALDYVGSFLMQGRAPVAGQMVREFVEPIAQWPVTMATEPMEGLRQAQEVLDPALAVARGLTTTRLAAEDVATGRVSLEQGIADALGGLNEMAYGGASFIPGVRAATAARPGSVNAAKQAVRQAKLPADKQAGSIAAPEAIGTGIGATVGAIGAPDLDADQQVSLEERAAGALLGAGVGGLMASDARFLADESGALRLRMVRPSDTSEPMSKQGFSTKLETIVPDLKQNVMEVKDWPRILRENGVTDEEMYFSGLNDWLNLQKGKVTKGQLLDFVRNGLQQIDFRTIELTNSPLAGSQLRKEFDRLERYNTRILKYAQEFEKKATPIFLKDKIFTLFFDKFNEFPDMLLFNENRNEWRKTAEEAIQSYRVNDWLFASPFGFASDYLGPEWRDFIENYAREIVDQIDTAFPEKNTIMTWDTMRTFKENLKSSWWEEKERLSEIRHRILGELDRMQEVLDLVTPVYAEYTLSGGENYTEVLMALPVGRAVLPWQRNAKPLRETPWKDLAIGNKITMMHRFATHNTLTSSDGVINSLANMTRKLARQSEHGDELERYMFIREPVSAYRGPITGRKEFLGPGESRYSLTSTWEDKDLNVKYVNWSYDRDAFMRIASQKDPDFEERFNEEMAGASEYDRRYGRMRHSKKTYQTVRDTMMALFEDYIRVANGFSKDWNMEDEFNQQRLNFLPEARGGVLRPDPEFTGRRQGSAVLSSFMERNPYEDIPETVPAPTHFPTQVITDGSDMAELAHVRYKVRTDADGKRILAIEELQSDVHQKGQNLGYSRRPGGIGNSAIEMPDVPFKGSAAWTSLLLKDMLRRAAEAGLDGIAWVPGEIQNGRLVGSRDNRGAFYDNVVVNSAKAIAKKMKLPPPDRVLMPGARPKTPSGSNSPQEITFHRLLLTPEAREKIIRDGFSTYNPAG